LSKEITKKTKLKFHEKIKYSFCLDKATNILDVDESINKILNYWLVFFSIYYLYVKDYNAYKHGHRIFYLDNKVSNKGTGVIYIEKGTSTSNPVIKAMPVDEDIIKVIWGILTKDFIPLYDLFSKNNFALYKKRLSDINSYNS